MTGAACSVAAVSAQDPSYTPGVAPSPFPSQAAAARLKIDATTACETAEDRSQPRNVQLAAWVECGINGMTTYLPNFKTKYLISFVSLLPVPARRRPQQH